MRVKKTKCLFKKNGMEFDPAANPGVLDTLTWDAGMALAALFDRSEIIAKISKALMVARSDIKSLREAASELKTGDYKIISNSIAVKKDQIYLIMRLPDGQHVFFNIYDPNKLGRGVLPFLGETACENAAIRICPVNYATLSKYVKTLAPQYAPTALGTKPRLGIGNRQTVAVWPGIIKAVSELGIQCEIVQNSAYRELAPMSFITDPPSKEAAYLPGHGSLNIGHTGTSIEGLWLNGVLSVIEYGYEGGYGADLDHIPVKSFDESGLAKAKSLIRTGKEFSFFTLDTSALFNLEALKLSGKPLKAAFEQTVPDKKERNLLLDYYMGVSKPNLPKSEEDIARLCTAYYKSINAAAKLFDYIKTLKGKTAFDFEFSLDEGPDITTPMEMAFCLEELQRFGVTVNFIAPNVGFEKRVDYRKPDGLKGLSERVRQMSQIAGEYGALLDFHSGSDKSPETYRVISEATDGKLKLKVSGKLQIMLAETLADLQPDFFDWWWDWTLETARREAQMGSPVAKEYVAKVEKRLQTEGNEFRRLPTDQFFTDYCFAAVGAKDEKGNFLFRDRFYSLPESTLREYENRVVEYIKELAKDLGIKP